MHYGTILTSEYQAFILERRINMQGADKSIKDQLEHVSMENVRLRSTNLSIKTKLKMAYRDIHQLRGDVNYLRDKLDTFDIQDYMKELLLLVDGLQQRVDESSKYRMYQMEQQQEENNQQLLERLDDLERELKNTRKELHERNHELNELKQIPQRKDFKWPKERLIYNPALTGQIEVRRKA